MIQRILKTSIGVRDTPPKLRHGARHYTTLFLLNTLNEGALMSFSTSSKRDKRCLSCSCWTGARTVVDANSRARAEPADTKGKCVSPTGPYRGTLQSTSGTCAKWDGWGALKQLYSCDAKSAH
ncbi:hypothetical protein R69749_08114 [Paraburkholderia domus]|jgi:hypothetical protein|nr:hypothetical protein R69749_08114 [Paraburkholderia domus]